MTSGIERDIILHSPTQGSPCTHDLAETPTEVRSVAPEDEEDRRIFIESLVGTLSEDDRDEDRTIRLFDQ